MSVRPGQARSLNGMATPLVSVIALMASAITIPNGVASGVTPAGAPTPVFLLGDSVLASLGNPLLAQLDENYAVTVDAVTCRRTLAPSCPYQGTVPRTGVEVLRARPTLPGELWVMALGYNDDPSVFATAIDAIMSEAEHHSVSSVMWLTLRSPNGRFDRSNRALRDATRIYANLHLADWNTAAAGHQNWFTSDGVHPNSTGATALAGFLAAEISIVLASRCAESSRSQLDTGVVEPTVSAPSPFQPASPTRLLDTRLTGGALQADAVTKLEVATPGGDSMTAAVLNVTAVNPCGPGYVTVFPCGTSRPLVSNLNLTTGRTVANQVVVKPDVDGSVCFYSTVGTDLVVDSFGSYSSALGYGYRSVRPERVLDTRIGLGSPRAQLADPEQILLPLVGKSGSGLEAQAVVLNVTATGASAEGYVTVFPCGLQRPVVSSLNFEAGRTVANLVTVQLGFGGAVCFYANQAVDLIADVSGAFVGIGDLYRSASPWRHTDTRLDGRRLDAGDELVLTVAGIGSIPSSATAVAFNLTAVDPSGPGYLSAYPCGGTRPPSSNVNYATGENVPNLAVVQVGVGGAICVGSFAEADVVVDIAGWYVPATTVVIGP
jgi:hypothetical protein